MIGRIVKSEPGGPARLPLLGKLKVGIKVERNGKEFPQSLDYFRADGKYAMLFHKIYGEKPSKVEIVFFSPNVGDVCSETYIIRDKAGRLLAEGDGEMWRCWSQPSEDYKWGEAPLEDVEKKYGEAKVSLTLRFVLPRIPSVFGIWSLTTKANKSSIPAIRDTFDKVAEVAGSLITNIPFDLIVTKVKSNRPGVASVFPVVELIPNVSQENLDLVASMKLEGQKIRGLLTEQRIHELAATIETEAEDVKALPPAPEPSAPEPPADARPAAAKPPREPGDDSDEAPLFG